MKQPFLTALAVVAVVATIATAPAQAAARKRAAPEHAALPAASADQIAASKMALLGVYQCEAQQTMTLHADDRNPGYLQLKFKQQTWSMKPTLSPTGALRIEDTKGRTMLLQIAFKSMLMDVKAGRRLVDNCVHASQRAAEKQAAASPPPAKLFGN